MPHSNPQQSGGVSLPVAITDGGTGATTQAGARTNLGLGTAAVADIGTNAGNVVAITTSVAAQGTITLTAQPTADETFVIGTQTFTFKATRTGAGEVGLGASVNDVCDNIVTAVNTDIPSTALASRPGGNLVTITASTAGAAGNAIIFTENASNLTIDGSGTLGATRAGVDPDYLPAVNAAKLTNSALVAGRMVAVTTNGVLTNNAAAMVDAATGAVTLGPPATDICLHTVRASAAPGTAHIAQWQASDNTVLAYVDHAGKFVGDGSLLTNLPPGGFTPGYANLVHNGAVTAYATLTLAKNAAVSGDTIYVIGGTYNENNLLKNGVNWVFLGATVEYTSGGTANCGIFDDGANGANGAVVCTIGGNGTFISSFSTRGVFWISNNSSAVSAQGYEAKATQTGMYVGLFTSTNRQYFFFQKVTGSSGVSGINIGNLSDTIGSVGYLNVGRFGFIIDRAALADWSIETLVAGDTSGNPAIYADNNGAVGNVRIRAKSIKHNVTTWQASIYCIQSRHTGGNIIIESQSIASGPIPIYNYGAGVLRVENARIECTGANAAASCVEIGSNTLALKNCELVASGAGAVDAVKTSGSAQNLTILGTLSMNKALNANVTPLVGTYTENNASVV
jgi:hypothetical protein